MSTLPRVNCHVHVFNLKSVTTDWGLGVLSARVKEDFGDKAGGILGDLADWISDLAADTAVGLQQLNEEALLKFLLDELDKLGIELPARADDLALRLLRRFVDRQLERLRRDPEVDSSKADLHDLLETLRIAAKPSLLAVTDVLMSQLGDEDAVVPLMMDLTDGVSDVEGADRKKTKFYEQQLLETSKLILAYPGRILPFVGVNSNRVGADAADPDYLANMREALEQLGFVGVKLYPSIGYELDTEAMDRVYEYCDPKGIPLLVHTNPNGFVGEPGVSNQFPHPDVWRRILGREASDDSARTGFPNLKVCLAHFGGSKSLGKAIGDDATSMPDEGGEPSWGQKIRDLILDPRFPNVYADVAFHRVGMESPQNYENYFTRLNAMLDHSELGERILFGTDFWMIRPRLRESSHWRYFEQGVETDERFTRLAVGNPARYLGLPGGGGQNEAMAAHVDFIVKHQDKLERPPTQWLLDAIEAREGAAVRKKIEEETAAKAAAHRLLGDRFEMLLEAINQPLSEPFDRTFDVALDQLKTNLLGAAVAFQAGGSLRLQVLNAHSQHDEDGILLPLPEGAPDPFNPDLERRQELPFARLRDDAAWLKTRLAGHFQVDAGATEGVASLALEAEKEVVFTDYRAHRVHEGLAGVLTRDLRRPRFAIDRDDVLRMDDGDAVSFATSGRLAGELTLTWEDLFVGGIDTLSEVFGEQLPLRLQVDLGATVAVSFHLNDAFRVVFVRHGDRLKLSVRKMRTRGGGLSFELGGRIAFQDSEALKAALHQLIAQYLGLAAEELEGFLGRGDAAAVEDAATLAALEEKLAVAGRDAVEKAIASLETKLEAAATEIAEARVEVGVSYQYQRLETDAVLLDADVSDRIVEQLHHEIIDGDFSGLLERHRLGAGDEIRIKHFLRFEEKTRRQSWGFHLGPVRFQVNEIRQFRRQENLQGHRRLGFLGKQDFHEKWPVMRGGDISLDEWFWSVDLRADMADFSAAPKGKDFTFGLAFQIHWTAGFHKSEIARWLDQAWAWRAVSPELTVDAVYDHFKDLQRKDVTTKLQLVFDHEALAHLLHGGFALGLDDHPQRELIAGRALAAGMPYRDVVTHRSPAARMEFFSALWRDLVVEESNRQFDTQDLAKARRWARRAESRLRDAGQAHAAAAERRGIENTNRLVPWTIGARLFLDGGPVDELQSFTDGLGKLRGLIPPPGGAEATDGDSGHGRVAEIYSDLRRILKKTHHLRTAGALLVESARIDGVLDKIQSSLVITRLDEASGALTLGGLPGLDQT